MMLWWIGNVILLLVVVPVLVALLNRVLAALERIRGASDDILAGGVALTGELDDVPEMLAVDRRAPSTTSPSARSATRAPSRSCSAEREGDCHAGSRLGDRGHHRADHRGRSTRPAAGHPPPEAVARRSARVIGGVGVVAHQTRTVPEVLPSVNANLKPVRDFCEVGLR